MHGMNDAQAALIKKIVVAVKDQPFTIGLVCDKAGVAAVACEKEFPQLCKLGVLRCPVNDGGMHLYQVALEVVMHD